MEAYLKKSLQQILSEKKVHSYIPGQSKLFNKAGAFEEIDLIIVLKDVVVIAEVKCIKYPFESRDTHNSLKRLHQAVAQVKRKMNFVIDNIESISDLSDRITHQIFFPLVITNYPTFSGYVIDRVPISDYYLFESYFNSGKLTESKVYRDGREDLVKEVLYYRNEDEMNANLGTFFFNPPPVEDIKKHFEIINQRISLQIFNYELYITSAQLPDDYNSEI